MKYQRQSDKKLNKAVLFKLIALLYYFSNIQLAEAQDPKERFRELIKGIEFESIDNSDPERNKFCREMLPDFVAQNIEYLEPIAQGKDINDPAIAKFNKACPNRFPINAIFYVPTRFDDGMVYSEEELLSSYKAECNSNMKIYQPDKAKDEYVLYCEGFYGNDPQELRSKEYDIKHNYKNFVYLKFDTNSCKMPSSILSSRTTFAKSDQNKIFKYKDSHLIYSLIFGVKIYIKDIKIDSINCIYRNKKDELSQN